VAAARKQDLAENASHALWSIKGWRLSAVLEEQRRTDADDDDEDDDGTEERITRSYRDDVLGVYGRGKLYPSE